MKMKDDMKLLAEQVANSPAIKQVAAEYAAYKRDAELYAVLLPLAKDLARAYWQLKKDGHIAVNAPEGGDPEYDQADQASLDQWVGVADWAMEKIRSIP